MGLPKEVTPREDLVAKEAWYAARPAAARGLIISSCLRNFPKRDPSSATQNTSKVCQMGGRKGRMYMERPLMPLVANSGPRGGRRVCPLGKADSEQGEPHSLRIKHLLYIVQERQES